MSKQINRNEIAEKGVLDNLLEPLKELLKVTDRVDAKLKDTAKTINESFKFSESSKGLRELEVNLQKTNKLAEQKKKVQQDQTKIEKQLADAKGRLNKLSVQEERLLKARLQTDQQSIKVQDQKTKQLITEERLKQAQLRTDKQIQAEKEKEARQNAKLAKQRADENNAYKQLSKASRDYKNESKRLGAELLKLEQAGDKNTKEFKDLSNQYKTVTSQARTTDKQLKKLDATVGDHQRKVGNYGKALSGASRALGQLGIAMGVGAVIRNVTGIITDFNQAQQDLLAISGKSAEELAPLTQQAKDLGASTAFSATQITELQIELAKLGFTTNEITQSTGGISAFASATGVELPQAAKLAGSALRAFNLDASEMDRVTSVLGVATTKTALDVSALETGLSSVAPVAASFGFSIEDTTALLGQLSNAGFDASSAATSTRNILLNLADANGDLAKELGRPIKSADDLAGALQELQAKGVDLGKALELTDKRSVAAFQTFMQGSNDLVGLRDSITDVNDELKAMEEKRLDSVNGQLQLLSSAWEGVILGTSEATGATNLMKNAIGFLAENLETILKVVALVGSAFLSYKATLIATKVATTAYQVATKGAAIAQALFTGNLKKATAGMRLFNTVTKMNPIGLLISGITAAITAFSLFGDAADSASIKQKKLNKAIEDGKKGGKERADEIKENVDKEIAELDRLAKNRINNGEDEKKVNKELLDDKVQFTQNKIKEIEKEIQAEETKLKKEINQRKQSIKLELERQKATGGAAAAIQKLEFQLSKIGQIRIQEPLKARTKALTEELSKQKNELEKYQEDIEASTNKHEDEVTKDQEEAARKRQNALMLLRRRAEDLEDARIENDYERKEQQLKRAFDREIKAIKGNSEIENRLRKELEIKLTNDLKELRTERFEELQAIQDEYWLRQQNDEEQEVVNRLQRLDEEIKKVEDLELASQEEKNELIKKLTEESEADITKIRTKFRTEREEKALQDEIDSLDKINAKRELANIKAEFTEEEFNKAEKERQIKHIDEMIALLEEYGDKEDEILGLKIERAQLTKKTNKEEEDSFEDLKETVEQVGNAIADTYSNIFQRQIDELKKQEDTAKQVYGTLEKLASEGNIAAQQSLAEQIQAQQEAQREQIRLQQKQANIEKARQVYAIIQSQLDEGKSASEAIASTGGFMTAIQGLIQSLPSFYEGTEDTGKASKALDNKGGRLAVLHNNERVLTADQNKHLQGIPNPMIPVLVNKALDSAGNSYDLLAIDELRRTRQAIEKLPQSTYQLESAMGQIVKMVATHKTGNSTTKNTYK
jgi:TP901 family phage tail tape measure protein